MEPPRPASGEPMPWPPWRDAKPAAGRWPRAGRQGVALRWGKHSRVSANVAVTSTLLCAVQVTGPGLREPASGHASDPMRLGLTCWGFAPASQARGSSLPRQVTPRCSMRLFLARAMSPSQAPIGWAGLRAGRARLATRFGHGVWPRGLATRFGHEVWPPGSGSGYRSPLEEHKEASHSKDPPLLTVRRHFKRPEAPRSAHQRLPAPTPGAHRQTPSRRAPADSNSLRLEIEAPFPSSPEWRPGPRLGAPPVHGRVSRRHSQGGRHGKRRSRPDHRRARRKCRP
jgi:hypothetical protein